jgi:hypothetical protein
MVNAEVCGLLERVIDAISAVDRECRTLRNGIEHGLVNVKLEFQDCAFRETRKTLTEEPLIAWLTRQNLMSAGLHAALEVPYPLNPRRSCDLVIDLSNSGRLWVELKVAWKAWFNCQGPANYRNPSYLPYLQGKSRTHSFRHDFEKLGGDWPVENHPAICLIGFDCANAPMDDEVKSVVRGICDDGAYWQAVTERHWPDRRNDAFRISVWGWVQQQTDRT